MNFDEIENLTEEQVNELFDDLLNGNEIIGGNVWCMECANNNSGCEYFPGTNGSLGSCSTLTQYWYNSYDYGGCAKVCGEGSYCYACVASYR